MDCTLDLCCSNYLVKGPEFSAFIYQRWIGELLIYIIISRGHIIPGWKICEPKLCLETDPQLVHISEEEEEMGSGSKVVQSDNWEGNGLEEWG